jgi:LPS sulfotransferase NodH
MQFFIIVGTQRTGTNILRETLTTNPEISLRGEVFSPDPGAGDFDKYLAVHGLGRAVDYPAAERQLIGFVKHLHETAHYSAKVFGFDVKYSQLRAISPHYEPLCAVPALIQFILASGAKIIHVVRDNVLQSSLSELIAASRSVWHHEAPGQDIQKPVEIDCRELIRVMQEKRADRQIFAGLLEGHGRVITCEYERVVRGLEMSDADGTLENADNPIFEIADFLRVSRQFRRPSTLQKIVRTPYAEIIGNYDAVVKAVRRTDFATYLSSV